MAAAASTDAVPRNAQLVDAAECEDEPSSRIGKWTRGLSGSCFPLLVAWRTRNTQLSPPLETSSVAQRASPLSDRCFDSQPPELPAGPPARAPSAAVAGGRHARRTATKALERVVVGDLAVRLAAPGEAGSDAERGGGAEWERRAKAHCVGSEEGVAEGDVGRGSGEGKEDGEGKCGLLNAPDDSVVESALATADVGGGAYRMDGTATPRAALRDVSSSEVELEGAQQAPQQPLARQVTLKSVTSPNSASHFALGAPLSWAVLPDSVSSFLSSPTPLHHSESDAAILLASDPSAHAALLLPAAVSPFALNHPAIQDAAEGAVAEAQSRRDSQVRGSRRPSAISHQLLKHLEEGEEEEEECDDGGLLSSRSECLYRPAWARSPQRTRGGRHEGQRGEKGVQERAARGQGGLQAESGMLKMHTVTVAILARESHARQERLAAALGGVKQTRPKRAGAEKAEEGRCTVVKAGYTGRHRHRRGGSGDSNVRTPLKERTPRNQTVQGMKSNFVEDEFLGIVEEFLNRPRAKTVPPKGAAPLHK